MKILIVRHADPDYSIDSLTAKGWKEAQYLSERLVDVPAVRYYVSPLGRAKDTASLTVAKTGIEMMEKEWLREFAPSIHRPDVQDRRMIVWDWLPQDWTAARQHFDKDTWFDTEIMQEGHVKEEYDWVTAGLDELLASHGYHREGALYRTDKGHNDTIILFCHFGVQCVLLSHLLNISPMVLWHGCCAAPSSVTTLVTEERREGYASFRMSSFGDISHLYAKQEPPAFAARFCEAFSNQDERHD